MLPKYVSSQEIVRNVFRNNRYSSLEFNWTDGIEWCAEALDLIGAKLAYQPKLAAIEIDNFRGELPCDLHSIIQVAGLTPGCVQFQMKSSTDNFHPVFTNTTCTTNTVNSVDYVAPITTDEDGNPAFNFNSGGSFTVSKQLIGGTSNCVDATYTVNDNYIFTSFKDTNKVLISYNAFPVDKDGFPLIPDNIKFKKAVEAYITMRVDFILWRQNDLDERVYNHSEKEWLWYVGAASTAGVLPNVDTMESIKDMTLRLIPRINKHAEGFKFLNSQEKRIK